MNAHVFGLECRKSGNGAPNTNISNQIRRENTWSTNSSDYIDGGFGARYNDNSNPPFKFYYSSSFPNHKPPSASPSVSSLFIQQEGLANGCSDGTEISPFDILVARGEYPSPNDATQWDMQRRLWYKLTRFPALADDDPDVAYFYTNTSGSSPQLFAAAMYEYEQAFVASVALSNNLDDLYSDYQTLTSDIFEIDEGINQDTTTLNLTLAGNLHGKIVDLAVLNAALAGLAEDYTDARNDALDDLETAILNLPGDKPYELAWITILSKGAKQGRGEVLDSGERDELIVIAESCPAEIGSACREVLTFMPADDAATFWGLETDEDCLPLEERSAPSALFPNVLALSPNPTGEWLNVILPIQAEGAIMIHDVTGTLVRRDNIRIAQTTIQINLQTLPSGVYSLQFLSTTGERHQRQFSIIK